ncbi:terpene synthase family protein [Alkalicoccobacillus plakortidis]|uniref:Terpene synthase n=1 Tax=Alkalicoccobacillus plakortidis TaxID=444060 RepID=A0ABT0XNA6_9BACI|nr:terpene synthase family protein [Alkalicoccobacillus plakortidis]MCM2677394.1 terpene synthase family protein [Alkalicoccobacillus plakortidis]
MEHAKEVNLITYEWAASKNILDPIKLESYNDEKAGYLAARVHHKGDIQDMITTSEFILLYCILDEYSDNAKNEMEYKLHSDEILSIFKKGYTNQTDPIFGAWADWWRQIKEITNSTWREQFIYNATNCFNTMVWEVGYRISDRSPSLHEYRIERQHTVTYLMFDLAEKSNQNYIPDKIKDETFFNMIESANKIVNWANDLVSLNNELEDGDDHNLIIRIQKENNVTLNEAINKVFLMHNQEVDNYMRFEHELLTNANKEFKDELKEFALILRRSIIGFYDWSEESKRYKTSEKTKEIKSN